MLDLPVKGDELSLGLHKQIDLLLLRYLGWLVRPEVYRWSGKDRVSANTEVQRSVGLGARHV